MIAFIGGISLALQWIRKKQTYEQIRQNFG